MNRDRPKSYIDVGLVVSTARGCSATCMSTYPRGTSIRANDTVVLGGEKSSTLDEERLEVSNTDRIRMKQGKAQA